ncbi:MAG: PAS domain-containing protein, partial [Myxococcota bacterium]
MTSTDHLELPTNGSSPQFTPHTAPAIMEEAGHLKALVECLPTNIFVADTNMTIVHANASAMRALRGLEEVFQRTFGLRSVDEIIGSSIHRFHKDPQHVERLLHNPSMMPHVTTFAFDGTTLKTSINLVRNAKHELLGYVVHWDDITEQVRTEAETARLWSMMKNMPTNIMFADNDRIVRYLNPASLNTLRRLEPWLPCRADEMVGRSIDIFYSHPQHQHRMLAETHTPTETQLELGKEKLQLWIHQLFDNARTPIGTMVAWELITERERLAKQL